MAENDSLYALVLYEVSDSKEIHFSTVKVMQKEGQWKSFTFAARADEISPVITEFLIL